MTTQGSPSHDEAGRESLTRSQSVARGSKRVFTSSVFLVPAFFLFAVTVWELSVVWLSIPSFILPPPSAIGGSLMSMVQTQGFWNDVQVTGTEMLLGYAIGVAVALILGLLVSQITIFERTFMPYIVAFQAVPKTALAPLFLIWFGFGLTSKVVTASLAAFFPILITVIEGLNAADRDHIAMLRSLGASRWQVFRYVKFPSALPFIFAGLNIGIIFALIGAVVAEFVGAQAGLGYRVLQANFTFDIAGLFATLIALSLTGLLPYYALRIVQKRFVFWGEPPKQSAA